MQSSNPALRNLGGMTQPPPSADYLQQMYNQPPAAGTPARERYLTLDDVIAKTATTLGAAIVAAVLTMWFTGSRPELVLPLMIGGLIVGLVLSLVVIFKQSTSPALILGYSIAEGIALGALTGVFESIPGYEGIGFQALVGTLGVFGGMLIVYKTGAIRVTPKFTKFMVGALIGVLVLVLFRALGSWLGFAPAMSDGGTLSIVISLVIIGVAALSFLLDFDQIDRAIRAGVPAKTSWYFAFSLMVTLVWLYLEILRLLSYLRQN